MDNWSVYPDGTHTRVILTHGWYSPQYGSGNRWKFYYNKGNTIGRQYFQDHISFLTQESAMEYIKEEVARSKANQEEVVWSSYDIDT